MFKPMWPVFILTPAILGAALVSTTPARAEAIPNPPGTGAIAVEGGQPTQPSASENPAERYAQILGQIQSIQQLRDVSPQDWSYEALKNLVENYGCIVGYPDRTFRGNRALSRNEFAAGLNACLEQLERRLYALLESMKAAQQQPSPPETGAESGFSVNEAFTRAFFNDTGRYWDITDLSGQANQIFGWRSFPGSFFDNQIGNDGLTVNTLYQDVMRQQLAGPRMVSRDLPNPFDTSLIDNPAYTRTAPPARGMEPPISYPQEFRFP